MRQLNRRVHSVGKSDVGSKREASVGGPARGCSHTRARANYKLRQGSKQRIQGWRCGLANVMVARLQAAYLGRIVAACLVKAPLQELLLCLSAVLPEGRAQIRW